MENYSVSFTKNGHTQEHIFSTFSASAALFWNMFAMNFYESGQMVDLHTGEVHAYFYASIPNEKTKFEIYRSPEFVKKLSAI